MECSGFEESPFLKEVRQVGFCDVTACLDEFELVFDGVVSSVVSRVVAQVLHDVRIEVGVSVFGKVKMELPQGNQLVEDILRLQVGDFPFDDFLARFVVAALVLQAAFIACFGCGLQGKDVVADFCHTAPGHRAHLHDVSYFVGESPAGIAFENVFRVGYHAHCPVVSEVGDSVSVAEHVVVEVHAGQDTVFRDFAVFIQAHQLVLDADELVVGVDEFGSAVFGEFFQEFYGVGNLDVFSPGIHDWRDGLVKQTNPVLVGVAPGGVKVTVGFAGYEMDGDFRRLAGVFGEIADIGVGGRFHVNDVDSFFERNLLFVQSPAVGVFCGLHSFGRLAHQVWQQEADFLPLRLADQDDMPPLFQIDARHVVVFAESISDSEIFPRLAW